MASTRGLQQLGVAAVVVAALGASTTPARAQYFGQNKVQYETFDFKVLKTDHFDIYYYPEEQPGIEYAAIMAERWYARLSRLLNHDLTGRQALIMYASAPHFRQTNTLQGDMGESTGGVTEILKRRIVLPFGGPLPETDHVIGHELVHAFQFDITGEGGGIAMAGIPTVMRFPLWFVEGMAEYLSVGPRDPNTAMWMRDATKQGLPSASQLADPKYFPYRYGQSLWAYIAGRWGDDAVGRILKASRTSASPAMAFSRVLRESPDSVVAGWQRALHEAYDPLSEQTGVATDYGRPLITPDHSGGDLNIAPALSPDGTKLVFLSERDLFSIDMYLADAGTGEVIRRITKTVVDPHFESLQFINSAGAWAPDGSQFVFGSIVRGRPALTIVDVERGDRVREIRLPDLGEAFSPAWSPDGRYIAFSGLVGGLSDLYVYDLQEENLKRLTNDAYAELQPAWSPDGSRLVVVTDRFTTGLSSLLYGDYALAFADPATGALAPIPAFNEGKHVSPQWSPDGQSLYFVSDQSGISNVYRLQIETGEIFQLTNLYTGVSGITSLSPVLSVAARTGQIAMSVYEQDANSIFYVDRPEMLAGGPVQPRFAGTDPALLPPTDRLTDDVQSLIANAFYGLPRDTASYGRDPYRTRFALDYIGQPSLAVGADAYGTYIAGGASLFWSDMLGNHNMATALQVQGTLKDISALIGYSNLTRRWNWGVAIQQMAYRYPYVYGGWANLNGQQVWVEQQDIIRYIQRQAGGSVSYPLNRAQRLEFSGGFLNYGYERELKTRVFDQFGQIVLDTTDILETADPLNLGQASLALVYDQSLFGVASPLVGQRYRLEVGANVGTIQWFDVIADFRKYVMPVRPFTFATRLMHYGRYGADSDAQQLYPLFLGYDSFVRGYGYGSFDFFEECESQETCTAFDQLWGSRILVANAELRFPPLGLLGIGNGLFGFLPIEMVVFGDAGIAWWGASGTEGTERESLRPWFLDGTRKPVFSAGTGLRMNLFGYMIIELDWVYPFNRGRGGHLQFSFVPGF